MKSRLSIRWRLTRWYAAAMSVILLIFGGLMYAMISHQLHGRIDAQLADKADERTVELRPLASLEEVKSRFDQLVFDRHNTGEIGFSFQISRLDGTVICGNKWLRDYSLPMPPISNKAARDDLQYLYLPDQGKYRLLTRTVRGMGEPLVIQVLEPYAKTQRELGQFLKMLIIAGAAALLVACSAGHSFAGRALEPLDRITGVAERISAENLSMSIAVGNTDDELGRLAATLNRTFKRLHESVDRMQRFTADAAHELRTPLSVLRTRLEVALRSQTEADELRLSIQIALQQTVRLASLSDQLLVLSRLDAGLQPSLFETIDMKVLLEDVVDISRTTAESKGVEISLGDVPDCLVTGDDISLSRMFFNLIENAIKYTSAGGRVEISGSSDGRSVQLVVTDTGIGIPAHDLTKVFDRFFRVDASRNKRTGGLGLGLAICRSIANAHQGEISISSIEGKGSQFTVVLPVVALTDANRVSAESLQA